MATQVNRRTVQFTPSDLTINERSMRAPYRQRTDENKTAIHWGQRKLHLGEVEFFTIYWDPQTILNPLCVYAGAAPGTHITLLAEMFPAFTFHLYDPAPFDVAETDRIRLFKEYFTDEVAQRYAGRKDVFLVSDIRTADYKSLYRQSLAKRGITEYDNTGTPKGNYDLIRQSFKEAEVANEDQIWGDMTMQQNWILVMNPEHAFIKFRLPYVLDGNDRIVQYLKGIVYWQVWPPQTSTETRLKPIRNANGLYELADWSTLEYEQWCFYHNTVDRERIVYSNPFTDTYDPIDYPELLNDYDSVAEAIILKAYLEKMGFKGDLYAQVKKMSRLMTWVINRYRTDEGGAKDLASKRISPVKSSSKAALDAFRNKRKGRPNVPAQAFQHTQVEVNPTWRQGGTTPPARVPRATAKAITPTIITGTNPTETIVVPPLTVVTPTIPVATPIVTPITTPTTFVVPPIATNVVVPPVAKTPGTIAVPTITQPTIIPTTTVAQPIVTTPGAAPTVPVIAPMVVTPTVPAIPGPVMTPTVPAIPGPVMTPTVPTIPRPVMTPTVPAIPRPVMTPTVPVITPTVAIPTIPAATPTQPKVVTPTVPVITQPATPTIPKPVLTPTIPVVTRPVITPTVPVITPTVATPTVPAIPRPVITPTIPAQPMIIPTVPAITQTRPAIIPNVPQFGGVPQVVGVPQIPQVIGVPQVVGVPQVPQVVGVPQFPRPGLQLPIQTINPMVPKF